MVSHPRSQVAAQHYCVVSTVATWHYCVDVAADPAALQAVLEAFVRDDGRSAYVVIRTPGWSWSGGVNQEAIRPAASLLKLAVAMAVEPLLDDLASERVGDLVRPRDVSVLHSLDAERALSARELHALMLSASDAPAARWATAAVGIPAARDAAVASGATRTEILPDDDFGVRGSTTAREAVDLIRAATDPDRFPACARALQHSIINSRIPLGVTADDIDIAHKTGTLTGVAHDVAHLACGGGDVWLAFLSEAQHDTLVAGYETGLCTRELLQCAGLQVVRTRSVASSV
jgi:beta-lactamase class A